MDGQTKGSQIQCRLSKEGKGSENGDKQRMTKVLALVILILLCLPIVQH